MFLGWTGCDRTRPIGVPSNYSSGSGDIANFFITEVQRYGGHVTTTNTLPSVRMQWWYKLDTNGFQVLLDQTNRTEFQNFLQTAFGDAILNTNYPQVVYKVQNIGAAIICNFGTNPLQVICLRAQAL